LTQYIDERQQAAITDQQEGLHRTMAYDGLDRLTAANGVWGAGSYSYDALDNLRSSTVGSRTVVAGIDAATNRLSSLNVNGAVQGFGYDANGNLTARGGQSFGFDIGNRLNWAAGKASYGYDGHGRRTVVNHADGSWKLQVYSGTGRAGQLLYSQHSSQGATRHVYLGSRLIAEVSNGVASYAHTDALGSPVARSNASAQITSKTKYEPYGATASGTNPTGIGFTGHVNDSDTGLVYMQQRYYEPLAGRFLSVDPVTTSRRSGSSFNRYAYAGNNPYSYIDPDGRIQIQVVVPPPPPLTPPAPVQVIEVTGARTSVVDDNNRTIALGLQRAATALVNEVATMYRFIVVVQQLVIGAILNEANSPDAKPTEPAQPDENNLDKIKGNKAADEAAREAGYDDAHDAKKGRGDSKVNIYNDKTTGQKWIWDGKKGSGSLSRNASHPAPPQQIRACGATAHGSCLGS
jgi:RHS repeat-associated protein